MRKVMLIEDDATMLSLLRTLLQIEGFEVANLETEEEIDEILEAVRREQPALVLLDVHLRQVNGFDLLDSLRKDKGLKHTRVLMSSGMEFGLKSQEKGADGFILKPYMPDELIRLIEQMLGP